MPEGPGYTFDPYADEGNQTTFFSAWISKFTGQPDGFLSSYREWHIFVNAIAAGLKAPILENVPECPPLWWDEKQYWDLPAMFANILKCNMPAILAFLGLKIVGIV